MVFWTRSFSRHYIKVHNTYCSPVQFNCPLQNIARGIGAVFLTIDMIALLMDVDNVAFAKNVSKL